MSFDILGLVFLTDVPVNCRKDESLNAQVAGPNDTEISVITLYHSNTGKVTNIKIHNITGIS